MKYTIPFLGALAEAVGTVLEKKVLMKGKISLATYNTYSFLAIVLILIPLIFLTHLVVPEKFSLEISEKAYEIKSILIMIGVIILSVAAILFILSK